MKLLSVLLFAISLNANAELFRLTVGVSTPFGNQDIRNSKGELWESGDPIGTLIISKDLGYFDVNLFHHSRLDDSHDAGVTGFGISKTWRF